MKTYNLAKEILLVSVPDWATPINLGINTDGLSLWYRYKEGKPYQKIIDIPDQLMIKKWQILSTAKEMTEQLACKIMPYPAVRPKIGYPFEYAPAMDLFNEFMRANNIDYNSVILYKP